jgi:hypothetical protein
LPRLSGLSDGYGLRAQVAHRTEIVKDVLADVLAKIRAMEHA